MKKNRESISFVTNSGMNVILIHEGAEYRAYEVMKSGGRKDMRLGAALPDSLIQYIKERR